MRRRLRSCNECMSLGFTDGRYDVLDDDKARQREAFELASCCELGLWELDVRWQARAVDFVRGEMLGNLTVNRVATRLERP